MEKKRIPLLPLILKKSVPTRPCFIKSFEGSFIWFLQNASVSRAGNIFLEGYYFYRTTVFAGKRGLWKGTDGFFYMEKSVNALCICPHKEHQMFDPVRDECIMSKHARRCRLLPLLQGHVCPVNAEDYVTMLKNELRNYPPRKPPEECHYSFATSKTFRGAQMLCSGDDIRLS